MVNYIDGDNQYAKYGKSISVDGDYAIAGAPGMHWVYGEDYDQIGGVSGSVSFWHSTENGAFLPNYTFVESDDNGLTYTLFGSSVSIFGNLAIIGANTDTINGRNSGSAYIYRRDGIIWRELIKLTASDGNIGDHFGESVAITEDYAAVGTINANKVYFYNKVGDDWIETIVDPVGYSFYQFGKSVAISGDYIIVGDPIYSPCGTALIYKLNEGVWMLDQQLIPSDTNSTNRFGSSVCIKDSIVVVGAHGGLNESEFIGSCYVFTKQGEEWTEKIKLSASDGFNGNSYGRSVAFSGDKIIVGAPASRNDSLTSPGAVYIYEGIFSGYFTLSPSNLDLENVEVGQNHSHSVEIKNEGLENLNISSISFSGTGNAAYSCDTEPFSVAPGDTYYLPVTFSPASLGTFEASLHIGSDGGNKTVSLTGNGSHTLSVSPHSINFGDVRVGEKPIKTIYVSNIGVNPITIDTVNFQAFSTADTVFKTDIVLPFTISGGSGKYLNIEFKPTDNYNFSGIVKISSSVGDETVTLEGTGYKAGIPQVWPDTIFFGRVRLGEQITKPLTIGNLGVDPIKVGPVSLTGSGAGDFKTNIDTLTVIPGHPELIYVSFFPGAEEVVSAKLNTNTNAGNHEIILTGSGIAEGYLDVTPDTLQFGDEKVNVGFSKQLLVGNFGVVDVQVSSINIIGSNASSFFVDASSLMLKPADIKRLNIAFIPQTVGQHLANLELISDGGNLIVPLLGNGIICTPEPKTIVTPSDGTSGMGGFGWSVSISGNKAIIGGFVNEQDQGSAYIFGCDGTTWVQQEKLRPSSDATQIEFGKSVDISGNYVIVGAPYHRKPNGPQDGAAFIYSKQFLSGWHEVDILEDDNDFYLEEFGHSVALDGRTAIVGAPRTFMFPNKKEGAAYIFHGGAPAGGKGWQLLDCLTAYDGTANYSFGWTVDISGSFAIVGTMAYGAYIFQRSNPTSGGAWYLMDKLMSSDHQNGDYFGNQVTISGDYALVSAFFKPVNTMEGAVYAFKRVGVEWVEIAKITSPYPSGYEQFGQSVSLSGDFALIGTSQQETVYLFQRVEDNQWELIETIYDDGIDPADGFGNCVALDANAGNGIIGVSGDFANNTHSGSAFIYSAFATTKTGIERHEISAESLLKQNYPNPFAKSTTISFNLPRRSFISLKLYNILGEEIETLVNEELNAGEHDIIFKAGNLPDGIYLCKLYTGDIINVRKMLLLK